MSRFDLPPRNPRAMDLHVSDAEWRAVRRFLKREPRLKRVLIFGSRVTGVRRPKDKPEEPDIDLGVELDWPEDEGGRIELGAAVSDKWKGFWSTHRIHVDWHGE